MKKKVSKDFSHEVRLLRSKGLRLVVLVAGGFFLGLGLIGVITPILPTTPFLLLAAYCFARSSPRFYNWMMQHRLFGPPLRDWINTRSIKLRNKIIAVSMLVLSATPSIIWFVPIIEVKILLALIVLAVSWFIASRPTQLNKST